MTFKLIREVYDRGYCPLKKSTFKAKDNVDALRKILDNCMYGFDWDDEDDMSISEEELKDKIYSMNGDGCDYIIELTNLDTNECLISGIDEDYEEEEEDL